MYTLYHSPTCTHCQRIFRELNTNGLRIVNVASEQFPHYITNVPTLEDDNTKQKYVGEDVSEFLKNNNLVEPFEFNSKNNMNAGFSFIGASTDRYCEPSTYVPITEI